MVKTKLNKMLFALVLCFVLAPKLHADHRSLNLYIEKFSEDVASKKGLTFTTSLEFGEKKIKEVSLFYSSTKPQGLEETRELIIKLTKEFLDGLNKNSLIKPDLENYPFTADQMDFTIFFRDSSGKYAKKPKIAQVSLNKGIITFYKYQQGSFQVVEEEEIGKLVQ